MFRSSSITIMKVSDIPIKLHISFLLVLPFLALAISNNIAEIAQMAGVSTDALFAPPFWIGLSLAVLLFVSVALHELAHSFVARSKGAKIANITLMLLGGVASMEDEMEDPKDEAWMAFAGPLFSMVLGILLMVLTNTARGLLLPDVQLIVFYLGFMNIFLAVFNLLPAFPSDGGRILRSLIARKTSYLQATRIATGIGKLFAFLFAFYGLMTGHLFLILIAFFIYIGASQEYEFNVVRDAFSDFSVSDLMTEKVSTAESDMTVQQLVDKMIQERHSGYPVIDEDDNLVGCVTLKDVETVHKDELPYKTIDEVMSCEVISVKSDDNLFDAFKLISQKNIGRLMVVEDGNLQGILTRSDIMKAYRLKTLQETTGGIR